MIRMNKHLYESPCVELIDVFVEKNFVFSGNNEKPSNDDDPIWGGDEE